ncbi:MAG: exosortase/archaeosortase family protein [Pirellulales bacterium]|nr:exosortase/archaeosortase family protein [Pirellulales bacterium]
MSHEIPPFSDPNRSAPGSRHVAPGTPIASSARAATKPGFSSAAALAAEVPSQTGPLLLLVALIALVLVAYSDMLTLTAAAWSGAHSIYSQGWVVPLMAVGFLWLRWEPFTEVPSHERWLGVLLIIVGLSIRLVGIRLVANSIDRISFIPTLFGIFMLVGGLRAIRWAWPSLLFLTFMFPLPYFLEQSVLGGLQRVATVSSTFVLQVLGIAAIRSGNSIMIPGLTEALNVAEQCSGLKMATIFGAMAVGMVFIIERPWWDKLVILLSAIPIAIIVNIVRIAVTALLFKFVGPENHTIQKICHDYAGLVIMMPLAMMLLWLELQILERVTIPVELVQLRPVGGARASGVAPIR